MMTKILHVVSSLDGGGVENLLLNYYKNMDRSNIKFDFIVHGKRRGVLEPIFTEYNSDIYHIPSKHESLFKNLASIRKIIKNGDYDVVHAHQGIMSVFPMYYAKKAGVNARIAHSHLAHRDKSIFIKIINRILFFFLKRYSNYWFACGLDAGRSLWGNKAVENGQIMIMKNAIDIEKFIFNPTIRRKKRQELAIEEKFVIGNVGRFTYQKNHQYLIKVFYELYKKNKDSILILVGDGELQNDIRNQVRDYGLTNVVRFLGVRNDVNELLQAMDVFLLPSRFEGLPVVLVEAQAAALKSFVSSTVTREIKCTDLLEYISLDKSPQYWAEKILEYKQGYRRENLSEIIKEKGYDVRLQAKKMEKFYHQIKSKS